MRRRLLGLLLAATALASAAGTYPAIATAAPVLVMGRSGHVSVRDDPFLPTPAVTPAPAAVGALASAGPAPTKRQPNRTVVSELARLYRTHQIDQADYRTDSGAFAAALNAVKHLHGTRAVELEAVIENLHDIAASGQLTPSRLPALFLTLNNNRQWWTTGPIPYPGQEMEFSGSQLVWEYYQGQGIELQVLATFGRADGMYTAGPSQYPQMQQLLSQMVPLAAQRGGGMTWEYYFHFDGGSPPWTSAMSQGTALEALTRASLAFGQGTQGSSAGAGGPLPTGSAPAASYLQLAQQALPIFTVGPPTGVRVGTTIGTRYLQYSFAPGTEIINAFLQALIGLYDYAHVSGNPQAQALFTAGNAEAEAEVPHFDTGAWSLYQPGIEDTLSYHILVTGFLNQLCARTSAPVYCTTAQHFQSYLTTPPVLQQLTTSATARHGFALRFRLSKYSHVGIVVVRGQNTVFQTSASFPYGVDVFAVPSLPAGSYSVRLAATDLAGNFNRITGTLVLAKPKR